MFISRASLENLHEYYLDGPPALVIEITLEGSEEQDRVLKRRLYEQAGIPEYWLIEAATQQSVFLRLGDDRRYHEAAADDQADELGWDSLPFAPRVELQPVPIRFAEFLSWCPEAKFENLGGGLSIGSHEGSRRCLGMLLMTLGLVEVVKLATPRDWVTFLCQELYQDDVQERTDAILAQARYESHDMGADYSYVVGEIPQIRSVTVYEDTLAEAESALKEAVRNWVLLRIARREGVP